MPNQAKTTVGLCPFDLRSPPSPFLRPRVPQTFFRKRSRVEFVFRFFGKAPLLSRTRYSGLINQPSSKSKYCKAQPSPSEYEVQHDLDQRGGKPFGGRDVGKFFQLQTSAFLSLTLADRERERRQPTSYSLPSRYLRLTPPSRTRASTLCFYLAKAIVLRPGQV